MADHYQTLGVTKGANSDEIKKAYRKLAMQFHPDKNQGNTALEDKFKAVSEAYDILSDSKKRAEYDEARSLYERGGMRAPMGGGNYQGGDFGDIFGSGNPQNPALGSTLIVDDISFITKPNALVKELNNQLNVFPNPTNGKIFINHNIAKNIDIYKLDGTLIKSYPVEGQETVNIDLSLLANGIYMISNNKNQHTTLIKQ